MFYGQEGKVFMADSILFNYYSLPYR